MICLYTSVRSILPMILFKSTIYIFTICLNACPFDSRVLKSESRSVVSDSLWPHGLYNPWDSPGQNTGVGRLPLLQGIFPTQGSNPGLLHCRQILYQLSSKGSPSSLLLLYAIYFPFSSVGICSDHQQLFLASSTVQTLKSYPCMRWYCSVISNSTSQTEPLG